MLCDRCRDINFTGSPPQQYSFHDRPVHDSNPDYYAYPLYPSLEALFQSSNLGCHLCRQIHHRLSQPAPEFQDMPDLDGPIELRHGIRARKNWHASRLEVCVRAPVRDVSVSYDLLRYNSSLSELLDQKAISNGPTTGSVDNLKLAKTWLDKCLTTHALCKRSASHSSALPSRVLDVECQMSSSGLSLCSSEGLHGPYVTLSHVWGHSQIITTTLATLDKRIRSISMDDLSQTFRDAVFVARQMSIRYLWIDSLCIIQDSVDDWDAEASKMGQYYMNAFFNIAAVSSADGDGGCFKARDALTLTPCPVSIRFPNLPERDVYTVKRVFVRSSVSWDPDPVKEFRGSQRPPLWQRAWVLQERLLSPRTLQFSSMQMSWKCRMAEASERVPEMGAATGGTQGWDLLEETLLGLKKLDAKSKVCHPSSEDTDGSVARGSRDELVELYGAWYDLVALYGRCFLTKPSDIFPAIAGIARAIALSINDRYISGLWVHDMHRGLLWSTSESTASQPDLRNLRAPSWSWAAINGTCDFYVRRVSQSHLEIKTDMLVIECFGERTSGIDTFGGFGAVEEVVLSARGQLKRAYPSGSESDTMPITLRQGIEKGSQKLFDLAEGKLVGYYSPDNADRRYLTQIWCMPIMTERWTLVGGWDEEYGDAPRPITTSCLALLRLVEDKEIYMRVGSALITDYSWFDEIEMSSFSII